mmetsp:Transcript_13617/g.15948  ORF Transcript_13617/g.15948 Transcript_13617/m.15948 type:complete len:481 (-) Transcript_13617:192-1634(-)|eukprot:CAMPEP_0184022624 /NCGR_PEP_ID=MMETSP0954-20121128/10737_1 /TAXON_ID=627963 /ORGANISM="Aplanochytrium sp, Strain PBS07" /LENGTH=480 /DNA_ID=CAMNT_0026305075 /DNA_START=137 /DNA_END=1579 /DNA_ORIENTATION=-
MSPSNLVHLFLCFAVIVCTCVEGKTVFGKFLLEAGDFDTGPEHEVTKYSFAIGTGRVEGTFRYADPHTWMTSPALYLFRDESWDEYHTAPACTDKVKHAHASIPIGKVTRGHQQILHDGLGKADSTHIGATKDGRVEWQFSWEIEHETRTHGWFLIVADCALEQFNAKVTPMEYEIKLLNPGNTHLPADEHGLPKFYVFVLICMTGYGGFLTMMIMDHYKKSREVHLIVKLIAAAYLLQGISILYELIHLWYYKHNGYGIYYFDLLSEVLEGFSQTLIAFVLICLASGWTLVETEAIGSKKNSVATLLREPANLVKGANVVVFGIVTFVLLSFILQIMNKSHDDNFSKFHDYESTPGHILVGLRLFLGIFFVYSLHITIKHQENRGGDRLLLFLRRLMLLGGLWFLSFPTLVFVAGWFAHYLRHRIVSVGVLTIQTACLGILAHQFVSEHSTYFKLSTLAETGVLPGAGGLVRAPKISKD